MNELTPRHGAPAARELAVVAARAADAKSATDIVVLDVDEAIGICDHFVIASAGNEPQVKAIVDSVEDGLKEHGQSPWHVEGMSNRQWVVLDYVHFVVHVFRREARENYLLERLWGDAPREDLVGSDDS